MRKVFESERKTGTFLSPAYSKYPEQIDSHFRTGANKQTPNSRKSPKKLDKSNKV